MNYWQVYWEGKITSLQRFGTEEFHNKLAKERLFHLEGGNRLLEFACGAGEVLQYIAPTYEHVVAADFSNSLLDQASQLINDNNLSNVEFIHADEKNIWKKTDLNFDRISAAGVVQYLSEVQLDYFIENAINALLPNGIIILFDIIDPRIFKLFELGLFNDERKVSILKTGVRAARLKINKIKRIMSGKPVSDMGYAYYPSIICNISGRHGMEMEYVASIYHEYRYHAILRKNV